MRIYYGWLIAMASLVILTFVMGATYHSYSVFVIPISEDFGLSRADANTGLILFSLGGAILAPLLGKLVDRVPIRTIVFVIAILAGASLVTLSFSQNLWLSATVLAIPVAIVAQGGTISATTLIARWFSVYRGRAMAIALFGMSLAGILVTPTIAAGVAQLEWRQTLLITGIVLTAVLLLIALIIRERPGEGDVESSKPQPEQAAPAAPQSGEPVKAITILSMPQFWLLGAPSAATLALTSAVMVTLVPLGIGAGASETAAASLIAVMAGAGFVGGLITAWIGDRVDRLLLLAILFLAVAGAAALFYFGQSMALLVTATAVLGLATGIASPAFHALIADFFGASSFGTAYGLMTVLMTGFSALFVRIAGEVFDRTGSYDWLFIGILIVELAAAALVYLTRVIGAPRPAASVEAAPR